MNAKSLLIFITGSFSLSTFTNVSAQNAVYPKPNNSYQIPFGKKMPPPPLNSKFKIAGHAPGDKNWPAGLFTFDSTIKKFRLSASAGLPGQKAVTLSLPGNSNSLQSPEKNSPAGFHLTKDINTAQLPLSSYPNNFNDYPSTFYLSFAVQNNVSYFQADDGIHGSELWRSDGTPDGTYLVKDINPGQASSNLNNITALNGKIYFSANTADFGSEPWISDGTEEGTQMLLDISPGPGFSNPQQFVKTDDNTVLFIADGFYPASTIWKTDGTPAGTSLAYTFGTTEFAGYITEAMATNGLMFFSVYTSTYGRELWRSDGTEEGTYLVKDIGPDQSDFYAPLQLTEYNHKLYFSGDDGTGRKLWVSDGTPDGTTYADVNSDVAVQTDFLDYSFNFPFPVLNNVLYFAGYTAADGNGLYKYDASNADGIVLVQDLTPGTDVDYIVPNALITVGNALYYKVINSIGDYHDELWTSQGAMENTRIVKLFMPGQITTNYYDGYGTLYFNEDDSINGTELWKSNGTEESTQLIKDISAGAGSSSPAFITPCNGKILFNAIESKYGAELWGTDGTDMGTALVKDINAQFTADGSQAAFLYKGIARNENDGVVFGAYTPELGAELYKSDGTSKGTKLLNDIAAGPQWSYPNSFLFKNGVDYFIGDNLIGTSIYKTDATKGGLQQIVYNIDRIIYYVTNFNVTDNGLPLYILANRNTGAYELWRSDGTQTGTYPINTNLYYNSYIVTVGNTAFFVAGDNNHGFELWKTDGTFTGTKMVKDIYKGINGSYPYSLFAYNNEIYFGAWDGGLNNSFWKSDGTEKGTTKLKNITPAFYDYPNNFATQYFCVSNNILYFGATDFNEFGAELWKTDGTKAGTKLVKDINPYSSYPGNVTDVNGTVYFIAEDGISGRELWMSNGTSRSTKMVKDITPGFSGSNLYSLTNVNGQLYFLKDDVLWKSDGTENNTNQVLDNGLNGLSQLTNLTASGTKLFFGAYSVQYGMELYEGNTVVTSTPLSFENTVPSITVDGKLPFNIHLYPNPVHESARLQMTGDVKNVAVTLSDMYGRIVWKGVFSNQSQINLPVERLGAGTYMLTTKSATAARTIKFVKQ